MALILSAATGNFNAGATWVGGIVPGVGDEARASNGHTITITANATCDEVSNAGTGIFVLNSGITLTANVTAKSTGFNLSCLTFSAASPATGTIIGNVIGGAGSLVFGASNASTGTLNITGNVTGGSAANAIGVKNSSTGTLNITGNVTGGSFSTAFGASNVSTGTLNITGNVTGAVTSLGTENEGAGTLNITGNVTGGSGTGGVAARNNSTGTMTITGNATGGSGSTAFGANNASTGTLTVTGVCTGGTTNGAAGANNASTGTLNAGRAKGNDFGIGSTGIASGSGVVSVQASITRIRELEYGLRGQTPTSGPCYLDPALTNVAVLVNYPSGSGSKTLSDPLNTAGLSPAANNVRSGVVYNNGNTTGTCAVPAASSVGFGVPVDATTGTAALTPASVWDHLLSAITTSDTIGKLLKDNVDATISSRSTATTAGIADAVWDEATSGHTTSGTYGGQVVRSTNANNELQINAQNHAAANVHQFQAEVITSSAFDASVITAFAVPELQEIHAIHGLKSGSALTVTPSSRVAGAISQSITGDGTTTTTVTRT